MSTSMYCFISQLRKATGLMIRAVIPVLSVLSGLLIALPFVLSPAAYAASSVASSYTFGNSQPLDQASVSVVRLVATYAVPSTLPPPSASACSSTVNGLGVFVGSWPTTAGSSDFTTTLMTDGSLVNPNGVSCGTGKPTATLSSVQIYVNDAYTNSNPSSALLKTVQCQPTGICTATSTDGTSSASFVCQDSAPCSNGVVLISFHTASPQPFIDMATADQTNPAPFGIGLAGPTSLTGATPSPAQATQLLTPTQVTNTTDLKNEQGMPIVNDLGQFLDMNTKAVDTGGTIRSYVKTQLTPLQNGHTNSLHDSWNGGIADYYKGDYTNAQTAFRNAGTHNNVFRAGVAFWQLATNKANANTLGRNGRTPTAGRTPTSTTGVKVLGMTIPDTIFTLLLTGLLVLLVIILALVTFGIVQKQMRQRREYAKLDRIATANAERIKKEEQEQQRTPPVHEQSPVNVNSGVRMGAAQSAQSVPPAQPVLPGQGQSPQSAPMNPLSDLRCPNCGAPVNRTDNFCQQCRAPLVISDSGLNVRLGKRPTSAPLPTTSSSPAQPPPPPGLMPSAALSDMPTEEIPLGGTQNGAEATQPRPVRNSTPRSAPPPVEQFAGRKLGLIVGTRSDPGIKRQHKPNEDSVFAAEGMLNSNAQAPQFGLFVVADGMGGHANGKDASRLAIQTIVETLMPRLTGNETFNDDDFTQLLADGVQKANAAVHERNMEHHADMGTTMTATLIVGTTAYMANVGDSRTYLYRPPEPLKKITHDHSVVASLVEAGIIKPEDVYTHSQRNQIYRSLGEKPVVDVDTFKVPLKPGDKIILCSDGLWEMVRDPAIEQVLNTVPDPTQTRNALIKAALDGGGEDNVSVIVIHIADSPQGNGFNGVQILAKPDEPQYPPM